MCWADCFLCCFSLQTGAIFTSAYMLALAIMGLLYLPFLPFSNEFGTFIVIYIYMILLLATFLLALFGSLSESKFALLAALILSVVALLFWLSLTVPSFLTKETPNCLGFRCGESHWMLPRQWVPDEDKHDNFVVYSTPKTISLQMMTSAPNEQFDTIEKRLNLLNDNDKGEKHLKAIETKLDELNHLKKAILAAQLGQPGEMKNQNPRKEGDKKKDTKWTNGGNNVSPANIERVDQETATQKPKPTDLPAEKFLERMIDQTKLRALNRKKHRKTEVGDEMGGERKIRSVYHDQNVRQAINKNTLWTHLVTDLLNNTNGIQREDLILSLGANKTLQSFLFGNETNSLISRTVNHQKTILSSCRAHRADSLINPTMIPSVALAFLYFSVLLTAIATLAMYYGSFLLDHGIEKCCVSECML